MKKMIALLYFMAGSSVLMCMLSLLGCQPKTYRFIYKMGQATFWQKDSYGNEEEAEDSCAYPNFIIRQQLDYSILTAAQFSFPVNNLFAFQFGDPSYDPAEELTDFKIYTVFDYNADYPAGSDISPICRFTTISNDYSNIDSSKDWVLGQLNDKIKGFGEFRSIDVHLSEPPAVIGYQQFEFEVKTANNDILRRSTESIIIKP